MTDDSDDWEEFDESDVEERFRKERERELSPAGIAEQNNGLLRQYRHFRRAADAVAQAWWAHGQVAAVALIGSLARPPWKEVPRFSTYRREGIELWHECRDVDLALWLTELVDLNGLRKAKDKALRQLYQDERIGVASHQVDAFIFEPGTDRYLGRLCDFNQCPKGKRDCEVPGCGDVAFLKQYRGFRLRRDSLAEDRVLRLFDRGTGAVARAADLPLPDEDRAEDG